MQPLTFDDLNSTPVDTKKPFFAIDYNSDSILLEWLNGALDQLQSNSWTRLEKIKNHYLRYKNIQYLGQMYENRDLPDAQKRYMPTMVMPLVRDAIDEKVARIMETKPSIGVLPKDDEERDKVDAKIAKRFLSHIEYQEKLPNHYRDWLRNSKVAGESYLLPRWNPDKGPKLEKEQQLLGAPLDPSIRRPTLRIGDIEYKMFDVFHAFPEEHPSKDWNEVNYIFLIEYEYTEGLKLDYPDKAGDIREQPKGSNYFDFETMEEKPLEGFTAKIHFYHKSTKYLPEGFYCCFTKDVIFKKGPMPEEYDALKLPPERLIPGKNEGELHGESDIEFIYRIAAEVNNTENLITKHLKMLANTKTYVEKGAVDLTQMNNEINIVEVKKGSQAPVMMTPSPVSPQLIDRPIRLKEDFYMFAKSNSVVRGEPPNGVNAFVALQYVSEAESRRLSQEVQYFQEAVVGINQKTLDLVSVKYKKDEERTMLAAGKDNRFNLMKYDPSTLAKKYSVVLHTTTGLPDSRSGKIQALFETESTFPGMVPREQVAEMIGFANAEKFIDVASAAARAAEEENEIMLDGQDMIEPAEWEDSIVHWRIHTQAMQDVAFKTKCSKEVQQAMYGHLLATEMQMMEQMMKSDSFAQKIITLCPQFPMIFMVPQTPPPPMPIDPQTGQPIPPQPMPKGKKQPDMKDASMAGNPRAEKPIPQGPPQPV